MKRIERALALSLPFLLLASSARAELWNALDTVPRPNAIIGYDTSVTMRINVGCTGCHSGPYTAPWERVAIARADLLDTMPIFEDYFNYGAFEYRGCGSAHIQSRTMPNATDPATGNADAMTLISNVRGCGSRENHFPGGSLATCITATAFCSGDYPVVERLLDGDLTGLSIPAIPTNTSTVCGNPMSPYTTFDLQTYLQTQAAGYQWPRWDPAHITGASVQTDFCDPLYAVLSATRTALNSCLVDPNAYWDLSGITTANGPWCTPGTISNNACTYGSPFYGTCVCNSTDPLCYASYGLNVSECGVPLSWKARQQTAVCEAYDPTTFGAAFAAQPDNRVNSGGCRENVAMFFTDGYEGHRSGVQSEAFMAQPTYASSSGQSNMFVFRVSSSFAGEANQMMDYVSQGQITTAFEATDESTMRSSFSQVLARVYRGDYAGSALSLNASGTRIAIPSFVVPGYTSGAPVSDTYIAWPSRIAWHEVDGSGAISPTPLFQTDWQSKVDGTNSCGLTQINAPSSVEIDRFGPGGQFDNGTNRDVIVPAGSLGDRYGDSALEPAQTLRWGGDFGFGATRTVIVEGANEVPDSAYGVEWNNHRLATEARPRALYTMGGGYVRGFHGGNHTGPATIDDVYVSDTYDDTSSDAGTELLRYLPPWMDPSVQTSAFYDVEANPMVPQRLTTGEMVARETLLHTGSGPEYRTLLVGAQGKEGRGYFVLDVTDPCSPSELSNWMLDLGDSASNKPEVYYIGRTSPATPRAVVIATGGLDGSENLYAYDLQTGAMVNGPFALPPGTDTSYPTAPVCVDTRGAGVATHCYVLRSDGGLMRVELDVQTGAFVGVEDITPEDGGGNPITIDGNRYFSTEPAVFYGADGNVNLVFGSGSHRDLTVPQSGNAIFKVVDESTRMYAGSTDPATVEGVCEDDGGGNTSGVMNLPPNFRIVSAPVVADGVVAWTAYRAETTGCISGDAYMYAMRFDTCADAQAPGLRPAPVSIGEGIPTSPVLHRQSGALMSRTSAGPAASGVASQAVENSSPGRPWIRKLYWRYELDLR